MAGEEGFKWRLEGRWKGGEVGASAAVVISRHSFKGVQPKNICCFKQCRSLAVVPFSRKKLKDTAVQ